MKKLLPYILVLLIGCSGCAIFNPATFDPNEYALVTKIRTQAMVDSAMIDVNGTCSSTDNRTLYLTALELKNYSQYLPGNEDTIPLVNNMVVLTKELDSRIKPSVIYCKEKLNIIQKSSEEIQRVVGSKAR